jgi:hypothetical protein
MDSSVVLFLKNGAKHEEVAPCGSSDNCSCFVGVWRWNNPDERCQICFSRHGLMRLRL